MAIHTAIIYYSSTGTNYQLAQWAEASAKKNGNEVRLRKVAELAPDEAIDKNPAWKKHMAETKDVPLATMDDLDWADAILFSAPTRYGTPPAQLKQFLDSTGPLWAKGKLTNKVVSAMSSAINPHGGQEATVLSIYTNMYHWGAIIVPPGYTDDAVYKAGGNPYGTTVSVGNDNKMKEDVKGAVEHQTRRLVQVANWLKKGAE